MQYFALGVIFLLVSRELKRQETKRRITDSATALVEKHGFEQVTVEDICAAAGISRRTFFNYMPCKDEAVLGPSPLRVTDEALHRIATTQSDNLVSLIISETSPPDGETLDRATIERRHKIFTDNPSLAHLAIARRRTNLTSIAEALQEHFKNFPDDRLSPDAPVGAEIQGIIEIVQNAMSITAFIPEISDPDLGLHDNVRNAAEFITDLARRLEW